MSRRKGKSRLPAEAVCARIEDLAHDGRGIARVDGKAVFIHGALPDEEVLFRYTARHKQYDEARVDTVLQAAPARVAPGCAHFDRCGGCSLQHLDPVRQIIAKQDWLLDNLARIAKAEPQRVLQPLTGPLWGYRHKARLAVKFVEKKGKVLVGFRERGGSFVADLQRCEVLHPRVGTLLPALAKLIRALSIYRRLPQIEVAVGDATVALSLRVLDAPSAADKARLAAFGEHHGISIYLQPKGPETTYLLWPEQSALAYRLSEFDLELGFQPYHFTQVNSAINRGMVQQAVALLDVQENDAVLDLFCGLGNFTLALARRARLVTGVEGEQSLVDWARHNAERNGVTNARFYAADLGAVVEDQTWMQTDYDKILLDPPRSGALEVMPWLGASGAAKVVYVSCHPATLARDAAALVHRYGYRLVCAGVMDMFPHTAHVESMVLFAR